MMVGVATGTGVYLPCLPAPPTLKIARNIGVKDDDDKNQVDLQNRLMGLSEENRTYMQQQLGRWREQYNNDINNVYNNNNNLYGNNNINNFILNNNQNLGSLSSNTYNNVNVAQALTLGDAASASGKDASGPTSSVLGTFTERMSGLLLPESGLPVGGGGSGGSGGGGGMGGISISPRRSTLTSPNNLILDSASSSESELVHSCFCFSFVSGESVCVASSFLFSSSPVACVPAIGNNAMIRSPRQSFRSAICTQMLCICGQKSLPIFPSFVPSSFTPQLTRIAHHHNPPILSPCCFSSFSSLSLSHSLSPRRSLASSTDPAAVLTTTCW